MKTITGIWTMLRTEFWREDFATFSWKWWTLVIGLSVWFAVLDPELPVCFHECSDSRPGAK